MKAIVKAIFEINVSDWNKDENLTKKQRIKRIKEDLSDFSIFMSHFDYENFKKVDVKIK